MEMSHLALTSVSRRLTLTVQCLMQEILLVCVCSIVCVLAYNVYVLCMFAFVCECVCVSLCVFCLLAYVCMCV